MSTPYPTAMELAHLAAALRTSNPDESHATLAVRALELWRECGRQIRHEQDEDKLLAEAYAAIDELPETPIDHQPDEREVARWHYSMWREDLAPQPQPPAYPPTLDDFLRVIVGGRTHADRLRKFKGWVEDGRKTAKEEDEVALFSSLGQAGKPAAECWMANPITGSNEWNWRAFLFTQWWAKRKSAVAATNAKRRKKASPNKKRA